MPLNIKRLLLEGLRQAVRFLARILGAIPVGWLVVMGLIGLPIAAVAGILVLVLTILLVFLVLLGLAFYRLVWRPFSRLAHRNDVVIETDYTVKDDDQS